MLNSTHYARVIRITKTIYADCQYLTVNECATTLGKQFADSSGPPSMDRLRYLTVCKRPEIYWANRYCYMHQLNIFPFIYTELNVRLKHYIKCGSPNGLKFEFFSQIALLTVPNGSCVGRKICHFVDATGGAIRGWLNWMELNSSTCIGYG